MSPGWDNSVMTLLLSVPLEVTDSLTEGLGWDEDLGFAFGQRPR